LAKKYLQRVGNGVKDGRQTDGVEGAQPADKVVRLPRDWLGPREDLVPFGPRASAPEAPPSAADFWGERSAAIHDAVQAPAKDGVEVPAGGGEDAVTPPRGQRSGRLGGRRVAAVTALVIAAVASASLALGLLGPSGSPPYDAHAARLDVGAVLSNGVARTLQHGLALLDASAGRVYAPPLEHHTSAIRRTPGSRQVFKRVHETAHPHPTASASSVAHASPAVVHSPPATPVHTYTHATDSGTSRVVSRPRSSAAGVSPTGQSGALGPIQSPNG
jgi:hypothetical protein